MRAWVGTSGFSYKEWKGSFYPAKLPNQEMLAFYSQKLGAVEINNTFYRMPTAGLLAGWRERVSGSFRLAVKTPRRITHQRRLVDVDDAVSHFFSVLRELGDHLGPVLLQFPPFFHQNLDVLRAFLEGLESPPPLGFEFRHPSWKDDATFDVLRQHDAAWVVSDTDEGEADPELPITAPWTYIRLRRSEYSDEDLAAWARRVRAEPLSDAYVFFKHEVHGPALAERLQALLAHGEAESP